VEKAYLLELIADDCGGQPIADASAIIVEFLYATPSVKHLTFSRICKILEAQDPGFVLRVIQYLSGARLQALEVKYELIIGDETILLEDEYLEQMQAEGVLYNPETGEPVPDFKSKVYPFFAPGKAILGDVA